MHQGDQCSHSDLTLSQTTNFRLFQTERFADDNFEFKENGRKLSNWVENNVGKGEIAHYEFKSMAIKRNLKMK